MDKMVWIYENTMDLHDGVASHITNILNKAIISRGSANFCLSGGSTPVGIYETLSKQDCFDSVPWSSVHFFWGDERCVPPEDTDSNYHQAFDSLIKNIPAKPENIHRMKGEQNSKTAKDEYIQVLSKFAQGSNSWPIFDIALMGIGEDGHTASLFPGHVNQEENLYPVLAVSGDYQGRPANRITLTPMVFNTSRNVLFLAAGENKAQILSNIMSGPIDPIQIPVHRITPTHGTLSWHIDSAASKYISNPKSI